MRRPLWTALLTLGLSISPVFSQTVPFGPLPGTVLEATAKDDEVLTACETGLGDILNGEGVYGLYLALVPAGAQTQVISLWKVSDEGTKDLVTAFDQNLDHGLGRFASLRAAQRKLHSYYGAAFIPSGNSQPLSK